MMDGARDRQCRRAEPLIPSVCSLCKVSFTEGQPGFVVGWPVSARGYACFACADAIKKAIRANLGTACKERDEALAAAKEAKEALAALKVSHAELQLDWQHAASAAGLGPDATVDVLCAAIREDIDMTSAFALIERMKGDHKALQLHSARSDAHLVALLAVARSVEFCMLPATDMEGE